MSNKNWKLLGEVQKQNRPTDSLLNMNINFAQTRPSVPQSTTTENELKQLIIKRIKSKEFDNYIFKKDIDQVFSDENKNDESESESDGNEDMTKEEMINLFWEIDADLAKICDFGSSYATGIEKIKEKNIFDEKKIDKNKKTDEKILRELKKKRNVTVA